MDFKIETTINRGRTTVSIGKIDNVPAVLEIRYPRPTLESIGDYIQKDHKIILNNDVYQTGEIDVQQEAEYDLACPASGDDIQNADRAYRYVSETYDEYLVKKAAFGKCWMDEMVENPGPRDGTRFEDEDFLVINDKNWNGNVEDLLLLLIFKNRGYQTIRDVSDLDLVARARCLVSRLCCDLGVSERHICMYFDFRSKDTRLHIKVANISRCLSISDFGGWVVLVDNFIKNLSIDRDYYRKRLYLIETR